MYRPSPHIDKFDSPSLVEFLICALRKHRVEYLQLASILFGQSTCHVSRVRGDVHFYLINQLSLAAFLLMHRLCTVLQTMALAERKMACPCRYPHEDGMKRSSLPSRHLLHVHIHAW